MLELYHHGNSACSAKVRLAFAEKGLEFESHYVDIFKGEQFAPAYARLNPKCVVPTLVHDGAVVPESSVICEYLDEIAPSPPQRPDDALGRARMRVWTKFVDEELHPATRIVTFAASHRHRVLAMPEAERRALIADIPDPGRREAKRQSIELGFGYDEARNAIRLYDKALQRMEAALATSEWLAGPRYSLADGAMTIYVNRLDMLSMARMWDKRPRLAAWWERMRARPSMESAVRAWIPPELVRELAENGASTWPEVARALDAA